MYKKEVQSIMPSEPSHKCVRGKQVYQPAVSITAHARRKCRYRLRLSKKLIIMCILLVMITFTTAAPKRRKVVNENSQAVNPEQKLLQALAKKEEEKARQDLAKKEEKLLQALAKKEEEKARQALAEKEEKLGKNFVKKESQKLRDQKLEYKQVSQNINPNCCMHGAKLCLMYQMGVMNARVFVSGNGKPKKFKCNHETIDGNEADKCEKADLKNVYQQIRNYRNPNMWEIIILASIGVGINFAISSLFTLMTLVDKNGNFLDDPHKHLHMGVFVCVIIISTILTLIVGHCLIHRFCMECCDPGTEHNCKNPICVKNNRFFCFC